MSTIPKCPDCGAPWAYLGFNSVECRNDKCKNFTIRQQKTCPCCGKDDHPQPTGDRSVADIVGDGPFDEVDFDPDSDQGLSFDFGDGTD